MDGLLAAAPFGMPMPLLLIAAGVTAAVLLAGFALAPSGKARQARRIAAVSRRAQGGTRDAAGQRAMEIKVGGGAEPAGGLEALGRKLLPRPALLRLRLEQAGMKPRLGPYFAGVLIAWILCGGVFWHLLGLAPAPSALFGIAGGLGLPHVYVGRRIAARRAKFIKLFPEAIDLICRGLKSGLPVTESMKVVSTEIGDPVGAEFRRICESLGFGNTIEEALWSSAARLGLTEFNFFVVTIQLQRETGGNLSETLENLADVLRKRKQLKLKIKALSGEARASAYIIGALPFLMFLIIYVITPEYITTLLRDPRGHTMMAVGGTWMFIGFATMAKMIRFEI